MKGDSMDGSIRELRASDATSILDAFLSDGDMARQGDVTSLEQAHAYIENFTVPHRQARVAAENGSDRVLAFVGASIDSANQNGWVFYWAHADARGRGITSSLVRQFCNDLLSTGGLHRLELGYRTNNPGSGRVAASAGFIREGLEREKFLLDGQRVDVVTCGRLASDPWPGGAPATE